MFGISGFELFLILAVGLLIFGPEEMPRIGRIIGQALRMFNDARQEVQDVITTEILTPEDAQLLKDPFGMKAMSTDLQTTVKQLADPDYKPLPKGAGMRVATDDALDAQKKPAEVASSTITTEPLPADDEAVDASRAAVSEPSAQVTPIDPTNAASIWGVTSAPPSASAPTDVSPANDAVAVQSEGDDAR